MNLRRSIFTVLFLSFTVIIFSCEEDYDEFDDAEDELDFRAGTLTYQAENYSFQSGCKQTSAHTGYTGAGFMDYGGNGSLVEWNNVNAPSAGQYKLTFRYANGSGGSRQCALTLNDATNAGNVAFAPTGAWTTWSTVSIDANLKAGNNKIRVTANTGSGGPNLDKMDVTSIGGGGGDASGCVDVAENKTATLSCPSGQVITSIDFASYGVPTGSCAAGFKTGSCNASSSKSKVQTLCLNKQSCTVGANNGTFGDPCAGTFKKLAVVFTCSGGNVDQCPNDPNKTEPGECGCGVPEGECGGGTSMCAEAAENKSVALSCPSGETIAAIDFASYGLPTGSCAAGFKTGTCHASSSKSKVQSLCLNKRSCTVGANNATFGDPCPGKGKKLAVVFTCSGGSVDQCPNDPNKTEPGQCGCGVPEGECGGGGDDSNVSIDAVFFAQTHVQQASDPYFNMVANRKALVKAHVIGPGNPAAPTVRAILTLNGKTLTVPLTGPATLPASIPKAPGAVQHSSSNSFTGFIPPAWTKPGLSVTVQAGTKKVSFNTLSIGPPTKVSMTMFDVQYFADTTGDYPAGWQQELEAKWPVSSLEVRRVPHVVFKELVVPARKDVGAPAVRVSSKDDYKVQTGQGFDGEQAAALQWSGALKAAAGTSGRHTLYYINIYGVWAGGQAGGYGGVGNGTSVGILCHELGHALGIGDCPSDHPYKTSMYGIPAPDAPLHVGPTWGYYLYNQAFIPPTVQPNAVGGTVGTYKRDPMCGGGQGDQEKGYLMRHFSDYSVHKMRKYLEGHVVIWNSALNSYASWDSATGDYTKKVTNNGVQYPVTRNASVISVMAAVSGSNQKVNMVYPAIGPYTAGLIKVFDPRNPTQRQEAGSIYCPSNGCDVTLRITQNGVQKYYMLAASWDTTADPMERGSLQTKAVNLPASDGAVTRAELLLTPDAEKTGLPSNPRVLATWTK